MISSICFWISRVNKDKLLHFVAAYLIADIAISVSTMLQLGTIWTIIVSFVVTSLALFGKEINDKIEYDGFDFKEILAGYLAYIVKFILFMIIT
jgi:hypothetical protein